MAKIIVIEDDADLRQLLVEELADAGHRVLEAGNGAEGLAAIKSSNPDVIISDIGMPVMDGYAVCEQLRGMGEPWSQLPIVFLTSVKSHALELLGMELGAYVSKPVGTDSLLEAIHRFVPAAEPGLAEHLREPLDDCPRVVVDARRHLPDVHAAALVEQHDVGEGAADIDPDAERAHPRAPVIGRDRRDGGGATRSPARTPSRS